VKVPLLDLRAQYATIREEVEETLARVVESQQFIGGDEVRSLEAEIAAYSESGIGVGCASGSDALLLALMALGVGPGDEVICPTYTFFATAGAGSRLGARPIFADIEPATYNVSVASVRALAERATRLRAIIPVHLYGQAADTAGVLEVAKEFGVPVIEDGAQAIGTRDATGLRVGARDTLTCFSFFPSKNLGAFGDAGMVVCRDEELAGRIAMLRVHGSKPKYFHPEVGVNSRLDALQAAVLRVKLRHLDDWTKARQQNAAHYDRAFAAAGAGTSAAAMAADGLALQTPAALAPPATHIYNQYVIRVPKDRRDALREHLAAREVGTEIYYPLPLHLQECFADLGGKPGDCPEAEGAAAGTLALPVYPELTREQLDHVVSSVLEFL
jgi:dTDP-4-amino-4,6-dideoxygalactose transaminase